MSVDVRLRSEAEQDVAEAALWYEQQLPGLGHQFLDEILSAVHSIAQSPLMYPVVHRNTRRALIRRFPFGIYFRAGKSAIVIVAVMHGSRHPRRWKTRV